MKEYNSLLIEISKEGRKAYSLPKLDVEFTKIDEMLDYNMIKKTDLDLPELSEVDVARHYTLLSNKNFGFVIPDNKKFTQDIYVPSRFFSGAKDNDKVVCKITVWPTEGRKPEGKIIEVLGPKGEKEVDLGEIVKLLKLDATKESDFLTQPVEVQENQIYPIANNGSASTPFYTALCLWVGAVLLSSLATTEVHLSDKDKKRYSKREQFFARMGSFVAIGLAQALIVTLGNYFGLGVDVRDPFYSVLFALLISIAFMIMVYVLVALFGNVGKGIAIIILVLSISGGGGNYPIQVSGKFFQAINPYLPFTHAVNLLRESAGGIYWPNAWFAIIILVAVSIVFVAIGAFLFPHFEDKTKKISEIGSKSHFFH